MKVEINDEFVAKAQVEKKLKKQFKREGFLLQNWKTEKYVRTLNRKIKNPQTKIQQQNRGGFLRTQKIASKLLQDIIHPIWNPYIKSINNPLKKFSGYTLFISMNRKYSTSSSTDYKSLIISVGRVQCTPSASVKKVDDTYLIKWVDDTISASYGDDVVRVVGFNDNLTMFYYNGIFEAKRKDCQCIFSMPKHSDIMHFYIFFEKIDANGNKEYSRSRYAEYVE